MIPEGNIFKINRKKWFDNPLKEFGFHKYKTNCLARVTQGDILQVLNFQKEAHGTPEFCINVVIRPLFWHNHEYLSLSPGFRLTANEAHADQWYSYKDEQTAEREFKLAHDLILSKVLSFFESTANAESIAKLYESKRYQEYMWGYSPWLEFDLGMLYLKVGNFLKSFEYFEIAADAFSNDDNINLNKYGSQCEGIIKILNDKEKINNLLESMTKNSIANLKLEEIIAKCVI